MTTTPLKSMDHFVHIGFDPHERADFTNSLQKRIREISDYSNHILNFVDEPAFTQKEISTLQIIKLGHCLSTFINNYNVRWMLPSLPNWSEGYDRILQEEVPQIVLLYLERTLWDLAKQMSEPVKSYEEWKKSKEGQAYWKLPPHIQLDLDKQHSIISNFMEHEFAKFLNEMVIHFQWENVFGISEWKEIRNDKVANPERKWLVVEYAEKLLWKERIIFSGMRNWDANKFIALDGLEEREKERKKRYEELGMWWAFHQHFWNDDDRMMKLNTELTLGRINRYYIEFQKSIKWYGFHIDTNTQHIVWGEYFWQCVHSYWNNLLFYWIDSKDISFWENHSLAPVNP